MKRRIGLSVALIAIILILGANAYIWRIQGGVYEYSIAVYFVGLVSAPGIAGVLIWLGKDKKG